MKLQALYNYSNIAMESRTHEITSANYSNITIISAGYKILTKQ